MLYRIHQRLLINSKKGTFIEPGGVHCLKRVNKATVALLLAQGSISLVQAPPLETFTGWGGRARKLASLGIDTIAFITMTPRDIAYAIRDSLRRETETQERFDEKVTKLAAAVDRWQGEIRQYLGIDSARVRRCCGQ